MMVKVNLTALDAALLDATVQALNETPSMAIRDRYGRPTKWNREYVIREMMAVRRAARQLAVDIPNG